MKLAFINKEGKIGGHLGHAENITIYDFEKDNFSNNLPEMKGGGVRAKWMRSEGVMGVVINSSGINAVQHMMNEGIEIFDGRGLTIEEALEAYNKNELKLYDPALAIDSRKK